jgi:predicted Zn-dependent protease with MMP-like domain
MDAEILTVAFHVSKAQFGRLVEEALAELPDEFAKFVEEIPVEIRDYPSPAQLRRARVRRGNTLLGLYQGRPRNVRSVEDSGALPDMIFIFQQPIESICDDEAQLVQQVRTTVLHEIGHHFGMDEKDLENLGYG